MMLMMLIVGVGRGIGRPAARLDAAPQWYRLPPACSVLGRFRERPATRPGGELSAEWPRDGPQSGINQDLES